MANYIQFNNPDGSEILVEARETEVENIPGAPVKAGLVDTIQNAISLAGTSLQDALSKTLRINTEALHNAVNALPNRPSEVEMTFALKATGEIGNMAISKFGGETNYTVKLVWKTESSSTHSNTNVS